MTMPVVFIGHGSPTLPMERHGAVDFLRKLQFDIPRPKAIGVISAHWETSVPTVSSTADIELIYDFYHFPKELYQLQYPAPGAPESANAAHSLLQEAFPEVVDDRRRGLDHGAWIPLMLIYPEADIPTFQISIQPVAGPEGAYALGRALAPLRDEGVLLLASGGAVHNLHKFRPGENSVPDWAQSFDDFIEKRIHERQSLADYRTVHPDAVRAHPRDEHLLPLLVAQGASSEQDPVHTLHRSFVHGGISMTAYSFGLEST